MAVLITGGCGFLAQRLAQELLRRKPSDSKLGGQSAKDKNSTIESWSKLILLDISVPEESKQLPGVSYVAGDITDAALLEQVVTEDVTCIFHLAAVLSGAAEDNYDLGMRVNLDGTRALLDRCRAVGHVPVVVFASSVAVFGTPSGGSNKAMCELLISDASRRGFVDGRCVRLPTVVVRPGKPNSAASSFCSSIIREPLQGLPAVCPVHRQLSLWIQSPRTVVENLIHAGRVAVDESALSRTITLPGLTTTPEEMVAALGQAGGDTRLVEWSEDAVINRILTSWPGRIATPRALSLGFRADSDVRSIIRAFIDDDLVPTPMAP
eukprot:jgi/Mesen1/8457/ME000476S07996